jgi:hypothetical protein
MIFLIGTLAFFDLRLPLLAQVTFDKIGSASNTMERFDIKGFLSPQSSTRSHQCHNNVRFLDANSWVIILHSLLPNDFN